MDRLCSSGLLFLCLQFCAPSFVAAAETDDLPDADTVIRRIIERAGVNLTNQHAMAVAYFRTNITEEYDGGGELKERRETVKKVVLQSGERTAELVLYNGRKPTEKQLEEDSELESRRREGRDDHDAPDRSRQINTYVTESILSRFVFNVIGRDEIEGRSCLLVSFKPADEQPKPEKIFDRIINHMGGIIWVDEQEWEMAKAEIQLRERVKMWGGFLASLDQISLKILRTRLASGFWIDRRVEARFSGRALTKRIDIATWDFTSPPIHLNVEESESTVVAAE